MTADEYLALGETQERYELMDGVVVMMSPSSYPSHNEVALEIGHQLKLFMTRGGRIRVFPETDVRFSLATISKPDLSVYRADRLPRSVKHLSEPPDLVIEILSAGSKALDLITKRDDYDRFGVGEYWVVDPHNGDIRCWRRQAGTPGAAGRLYEAVVEGDTVPSQAIHGFVLDITRIRELAGPE